MSCLACLHDPFFSLVAACLISRAQDALFSSLGASQFSQALAMCGLAAFASRRMQQSHIQAPEQQLTAFLTFMGLLPLPGQQQQLGAASRAAGTSDALTGRTKGVEAQMNSSEFCLTSFCVYFCSSDIGIA